MSYDLNSLYPASISVLNENGVLVTPSTVSLTITRPDQTTFSPTPNTSGTGKYYYDVLLSQEGLWKFVWVTIGPNGSKTDYENAIAFRSIVSLEDMRNYLHLGSTSNDELLRGLMHDSTELVEKHVGTCVIRQFVNDFIPGDQRQAIRLPHGPCPNANSVTSISSVWPGGPSWPSSSPLIVNPDMGVVDTANFLGFWYGPWTATYTGGRIAIPQSIVLATKIIVDDLYAPHRDTTTDPLSPSYDQESAMIDRMPSDYEMPPRAMNLLKRYRRPGFA